MSEPEDIVSGDLRVKATELMQSLLLKFDYMKIDFTDRKLLLALLIVMNDYGADLHNRINGINPVNWALFWKFAHEQASNELRAILQERLD